jgi:hypothetical protein
MERPVALPERLMASPMPPAAELLVIRRGAPQVGGAFPEDASHVARRAAIHASGSVPVGSTDGDGAAAVVRL